MEGAHEIGGKHEAAFQHGNDQQAFRLRSGNLGGKRFNALGDHLRAEQHVDAVSIDELCCHGAAFELISSSRANRISRSSAFSGGAARRVRKFVDSPGLSAREVAGRFQV